MSRWENVPADADLDKMRGPEFDPRRVALIDGESPPAPPGSDSLEPSAQIFREAYRNNSLRYRVKTDRDGIFLLSETWFPYWNASVNGREQPLLRANYLFRGVHLGPGEHAVEMRYSSPPMKKALGATLAAALGLLALCWGWAQIEKKE